MLYLEDLYDLMPKNGLSEMHYQNDEGLEYLIVREATTRSAPFYPFTLLPLTNRSHSTLNYLLRVARLSDGYFGAFYDSHYPTVDILTATPDFSEIRNGILWESQDSTLKDLPIIEGHNLPDNFTEGRSFVFQIANLVKDRPNARRYFFNNSVGMRIYPEMLDPDLY